VPTCDDANPCTADVCAAGSCSYPNLVGAPCDDGDPCYSEDFCSGGSCQAGNVSKCDDGLSCTLDACKPNGECVSTIDDNNCLIDGACYAFYDHAPNNDCKRCDPAVSKTSFSPRPTGSGCTLCNYPGVCFNGTCVIAPEVCPP